MIELIALAIALYITSKLLPKLNEAESIPIPTITNPGLTGWEVLDTSQFYSRNDKSKDVMTVRIQEPAVDINRINSSKGEKKRFIYRPETFDQYIGQPLAKAKCKLSIQKIKEDIKTHILIDGIRGHGKTTLVRIVAKQLNAKLIERVGKLVTVDNLPDILNEINASTDEHVMFFIDEMDKLSSDVLKIMNPVLEDYELAGAKIRRFIFAGATINKYDLINRAPDTLDRIDTQIRLERYSVDDVYQILSQYHTQLYSQYQIKEESLKVISSNCKFNPRTGIAMLTDLLILKEVEEVLTVNNVLKDGLTSRDKRILETLAGSKRPLGANALAQLVGISQADYQAEYEPYLCEMGYVARVPSRVITDKGRQLLEVLK